MNLLPNSCIIAKENEGLRVCLEECPPFFIFRAKDNIIALKKIKSLNCNHGQSRKLFLDGLELLNKNYIILLGRGAGLGLRRT
jgi:hypothetical protein